MFFKLINRLTMLSNGIDFDEINIQTMSTNKFISACINKRYPVTRYIISNTYKFVKNYKFTKNSTNDFEEFIEYIL